MIRMDPQHIRNFSVIAHIDHGKSTLADRFLEITGALQAREMEAQVLDAMDLERERGITIKAHPVRLNYTANDGEKYVLNLIDTPGHVDFSYEVTRSLAACEGALLLVDASQGVEAQTLANAYLAVENNLEIIPVINKIDLPSAQPEEARRQIADIIGLDGDHAILASAKEGTGVPEILEAIVAAPAAAGRRSRRAAQGADLRLLVRPLPRRRHRRPRDRRHAAAGDEDPADGRRAGLRVAAGRHLHAEGRCRSTSSASARSASSSPTSRRSATRRSATRSPRPARPALEPFPGFKQLKPMVFAGLYPVEGHQYPELRDALEKLRLNDASFFYEPETSVGARLRVPLRLPRPAAHGDRAGAARARVRHGPGHDGAGRAVPRDDDRRRRCRRSTARPSCPTPAASRRSRSR